MADEKRTPLQRALISLGFGGVGSYGLTKLLSPQKLGEKAIERAARGAGIGGVLSQGGAELGGHLDKDSFGSRALGGAIGGGLGGVVSGGTDPQLANVYKYLISAKGMTPNKAAALMLGSRAAFGGAAGALGGVLTRPFKESE